MIRLFDSIEADFTHNGIQVLDDIVYGDACILTNEINGTYSLEMELSIVDNEKWKDVEVEKFLKVPTSKGEQIFRIKEIVKGINSIKVYGKHVFFDLENNFILDINVVQKDGRGAINQILGAMSNNMINSYNGTSNISIVNNSRLVRKNVVSALIGSDDNSFVNRWGGELEVDNFNFSMKMRIGEDRDFQVRYRKNLTGFEGNTNTYNLCTRIVPVGFDGIMLESTKWVDSQYINNYPQIYTYEIKFDDIKVKENIDDEEGYNTIEEARAALRQAAENYFITSKCDIPSFSANVNFETLKYTEEHKDLQILERVELGDDINVYIDKIDININARVVKTTYNFFTEKYKELEIGDVKPNLFKQIANLKNNIDLVTEQLGGNTWQDILDKALDEATKLMQEGLKDSYVITMKNQIVIGDAPNINDMVNCIVLNKNGIGFSNNGYLPDSLVSAMTIDGKINASCITTGVLNANLIKTGLLQSFNGYTTLNMETGSFGNVVNGYGVEMDRGGLIFSTAGEIVGGIRSSRFLDNTSINGISIVNTNAGDYVDIGFTDSENLEGNPSFYPKLRISKTKLQQTGDFIGIQLLDNVRIAKTKIFYLESNDSSYPHEVYNNADGQLSMFGDNGVMLGYMEGNTKVKAIEVYENANQYKVLINKPLSLQNNPIYGVPNIYTDYGSFRYMNESWCGSIEATARRISNLNVYYSSGWYSYSSGSQGAPSDYGVLLHLKWGESDFVQIAFDFANSMYQRAWINGAWTSWTQR